MMADLTEKVIDMLDDSTLEAVKLTQFVNILRLMNAPRDKVLKKFLSAHSRRSITMTSQFNESIDNKSQSVATARQYHQSMLVGLIESCKGIHELYQGTSSLPLSENDSVLAQIETEFYNSIQRTFQDYTKTLSKGFHAFFQRYHEVFRNVNLDLSPLTEENVVLIQDFNLDLRAPSVPSQEEADTSSNHFNYQDERGSWLLLARQSILDVKYLDSTFTETCQLFHLSAKKRAIPGQLFSSAYSDSILTEIDIHTTFMRKHFLKSFVADLIIWFPRHLTIVQASSEETSSSSADRTLFQKKWQAIQVLMSLTSTHASEAFSECARYIKPLVDIYEVAALDPSILCKKLIVEFSTFLVQEIESSCGLLRNRTLLKDKKLFQEEDHDIYEVAELEFNKQIGYEFDRKSNSTVKENILLYFAGILKYLLKSLPEIVVEELSSHEFPPIEDTSLEQGLSQRKIEETVRDLISYFIEVNARYSADVLALASLEHYQQHYSKVSQGNEVSTVKSITISDKTQAFLEYLDQIAATGYLLFLESPPQVRSSTGDQRRTPGRQSIAMGNSNLALQMDIERLFSQRVKVFNTVTASSGNEVIISTVLKAAIKSVQEEIRNSTLVYEAYVQIRAEIGLLKSISPYLIKETSEIDSLVDLLLSTVFSRYVGANDISNVNDTSEVGLVSKAHSEVLQRMADRLSLVGKTR